MSPRREKQLNPRSRDFPTRFARHLRQLLKRKRLSVAEFRNNLRTAGLNVSMIAVRKWLSAERVPHAQDFEAIAKALGIRNYKNVMPPPLA